MLSCFARGLRCLGSSADSFGEGFRDVRFGVMVGVSGRRTKRRARQLQVMIGVGV